jgi:hypothetical protein
MAMRSRSVAGGLIAAIICISFSCIMYDLREYEQFPQEENVGLIERVQMMSTEYCAFNLDFADHLVLPDYQYESFEIDEIVVKSLSFMSNSSEPIEVSGQSYGGLESWSYTTTRYHSIILRNISLQFVYSISIRMQGPDTNSTPYPLYVDVIAHFTVYSTFERPPKHTITETILSIDLRSWMFLGVVVLTLPIIVLARRLSRE